MANIYQTKRRLKNGSFEKTWYGRVYHEGRKLTKSLRTESRTVANARLQEWVEDLKSSGWKEKKVYSFREAAAKFIDEHFPRIKHSSAVRYDISIKNLDRIIGEKNLDEITKATLSDFETTRRREGVTDSTIRRDLACMAAIFRCAEEWEWHEGNPANAFLRAASKRGLTEAPPRTRYLSHEEEETILAAIEDKLRNAKSKKRKHAYRMLYAAVAISIDTGLRREELMGLPWHDVSLLTSEITITMERAKAGRMRAVPILPRSQEILQRMASTQNRLVLHNFRGVQYVDLAQSLDRLTEKLGITDLRWHDLRRTCGCRLIQDHNMSIEKVSLWLGHSSIEQTQRAYAFLDVRHLHAHLRQNTTKAITSGYKNEDGTL
jgi:integrase